jgi:hypothetical protein
MAQFAGAIADQVLRVGPGVTYIGDGQFMAAWAGYCVTCTPFVRQSTIYYAIYDLATDTWGAAEAISDTTITYTTMPRHQGLTLFSNADGNVGLAVNVLYVASGSVDTNTESDQARKLQVARWQTDNGWFVNSSLVGDGCKPSVTAVMTNLSSCSHRPVGILFPSGNTVVLFQEQDGLGHYHLSAVEFK